MNALIETLGESRDPRTINLLAKSLYRELKGSGLAEQDVRSLAGELLSLVTADAKSQNSVRG
jgi:hypothetical protein